MKLGLTLNYSGRTFDVPIAAIREAEAMGADTLWTAEAYGTDALTPLAFVGAQTTKIKLASGIAQISARTPTATAMAAMTIDVMTGGRMILGLGASGPQVVEGWYGQPYAKPLARMREYVGIVRQVLAREQPVTADGHFYRIPYHGEDSVGLGKPLKSILHGRSDIPIVIGAEGPKNIELTAELADGWIATLLSPRHFEKVYGGALRAGFARAGGGKSMKDFSISVMTHVVPGADLKACRDEIRPTLALYVGGMGARGRNFHKNAVDRYGFEEVTTRIQDLYLAGRKQEATALVPDDLVDQLSLIGPKEHMREQLAEWRALGVDFTLLVPISTERAERQLQVVRELVEIL